MGEQRREYLIAVAERHLDQAKAFRNKKKAELFSAEVALAQAYDDLESARVDLKITGD